MQVFPYEKSGCMKAFQQKITIFEGRIFDKLAFVFGARLSCLKILSVLAKLSSEILHFFYLLSRSVRAWEIPVSVFVVASSLVHVCSSTGELNTCSLACLSAPCCAVGWTGAGCWNGEVLGRRESPAYRPHSRRRCRVLKADWWCLEEFIAAPCVQCPDWPWMLPEIIVLSLAGINCIILSLIIFLAFLFHEGKSVARSQVSFESVEFVFWVFISQSLQGAAVENLVLLVLHKNQLPWCMKAISTRKMNLHNQVKKKCTESTWMKRKGNHQLAP